MSDPNNQDTPVAWIWEDSTGCIYMCADRPDAVEMAASVSAEAVSLYSSDQIDAIRRERDYAVEAMEEARAYWRIETNHARAAEAVRDEMEDDRDRLKAELDALKQAVAPFCNETIKTWVDEHGWTAVAPSRDRICDWFGPSDFRTLLTKLQDTSHE